VTSLRTPLPGVSVDEVACAGVSLCVAVDNNGDIFTGTAAG
jgi:ferredoxin